MRCLIVSPHFPPSTLAGVHRARHLVKSLPDHGWRPTVICVDPAYQIERLDPQLASLVPAHTSVISVAALPVKLTRLVGVGGDIGLRSLAHIRRAIATEMRNHRPHVVLISGSPYFPMLLAGWIERHWKVPVVLDFQDPWVTEVGAKANTSRKAWLSHQLARVFEPKVVRQAAFITSVSERQNFELVQRYPFLDPSRMAAIPIGGDPQDFASFDGEVRAGQAEAPGTLRLVYTGTIWPGALPVLKSLLLGIRMASVALAGKVDIKAIFMGTTANPNAVDQYRVLPLADRLSIADLVEEIPDRRPYLEAVQLMSQANVNLIIGSLEPHYTASKIYPILMANRPHLSMLHRSSSAHATLKKAGGGIALGFESQEELEKLPAAISDALVKLAADPESLGQIDPSAYADSTAHAVAGRFAAIFEKLVKERGGQITDASNA